MFKKEITAAFIKNCPLSGAFAFRCAVSEGISLPFRAEVALFSDTELTPEELESCLLVKTELTLMQYDTTGALSRGRKFQGVITSYNALGLISDLEGYELLTDCYGYEIVIEPEMALMGLSPRTRRFDSGKTPAEIITEIFGEYQQKCLFDPKLFDKMPECGQIAQESNETDLNFINRICFNYGFNYIFELEAPEEEFSGISVVFSRGYRTGNGHEITGNTHSGLSEIPCRTGKTGSRFFGDSAVFLDRLVRTGIAGSGSIRGNARNGTPFFRNGFEPVRGEGHHPGESIDAFGRESAAALDRLSRNRTLISARDFAVASGITLDTGKTRYLTVRTRFSFNLNFPKNFRRSSNYPATEDELRLTAVAVPVPENTDETLGALCCFGPIPENPTPANAFVITDIPRPGRESLRAGGQDLRSNAILKEDAANNAMIVKATVCDKSGNTASPGTIVTSENDDTAFPAMFYALPENGSVIEANYVSMSGSASPLGNFPKVGEKVLLLYVGSSYYFMGYLPNGNALNTYSKALRNDLLHSSFLSSGYDPDSAAAAALTDKIPTNENRDIKNQRFSFNRFSSSAALVEYIIMQNRLEQFMKCLAYKFNTNKVIEVYDDNKDKVSSCLSKVITCRKALDEAVQNGSDTSKEKADLADAYSNLSGAADSIVSQMKALTAVKDQINSIFNDVKGDENNTRYSGTDDDKKEQILGDLLGVVSSDLFYDGTHRIYGNRMETAASDDISTVAEGDINLHAGKNLYLTADNAIQLQVGHNTITINANTIALAAAYFKTSLFPWDSKITLSPTGGVRISGCQFSANGFISATVSDGLGGSVGTRNGLMSMAAPKIRITNLGGPALLKTLGKMADNFIFGIGTYATYATGGVAKLAGKELDNTDLTATIINDVNGYANSVVTLASDIWATVERFKSIAKSGGNAKAWANISVSLILMAIDALDTIDNIVVNAVQESNAKNNVFVKRTKENHYFCGNDAYLMVSSSVRIITLLTNELILMGDTIINKQVSSTELTATGVNITGRKIQMIYGERSGKATPLAAKDIAERLPEKLGFIE